MEDDRREFYYFIFILYKKKVSHSIMILFRFHEEFLQFSIFLVARTWYVYEYVSRGNTVAWKQECFSKNHIRKKNQFFN